MTTLANTQREMAFLTEARKAVDVPIEFVKACKDELAALTRIWLAAEAREAMARSPEFVAQLEQERGLA